MKYIYNRIVLIVFIGLFCLVAYNYWLSSEKINFRLSNNLTYIELKHIVKQGMYREDIIMLLKHKNIKYIVDKNRDIV